MSGDWMSPKLKRDVQRVVKDHCANMEPGTTNCLYCSAPCFFYHALMDGQQTPRCKYAEDVVLCAEPAVNAEYHRQLKRYLDGEDPEPAEQTARCVKCGKSFIKRSNRHKYCPSCKVVADRESAKRYMRGRRQRIKNAG